MKKFVLLLALMGCSLLFACDPNQEIFDDEDRGVIRIDIDYIWVPDEDPNNP